MVFKQSKIEARRRGQSRIRIIPQAFVAAIAVGTLLLMLPFARAGEGRAYDAHPPCRRYALSYARGNEE